MSKYHLSPISRDQAQQLNQERYFTGEACRNGHVSERRVSDKICVTCELEKGRRYRATDKGRACIWRNNNNDQARTRRLRWTKTPQGRIVCNRNNKTAKGKAARRRFDATEKGRLCNRRQQHARRARLFNQTVSQYSFTDRLARFRLFGDLCAYCGQAGELVEDHFIPIARNGAHRIENIVPACKSCNWQKNRFLPESWYKKQPFFDAQRWEFLLTATMARDAVV